MTTTIDEYAQRPKRALQADGTMDMFMGFCCFGLALINYAAYRGSASMIAGTRFWESPAYHAANTLFFVAILAANAIIILGSYALIFLKKRFVYPRLGYVVPRTSPWLQKGSRTRRMVVALVPILGIGVVGVLIGNIMPLLSPQNLSRVVKLQMSEWNVVALGVAIGVALLVQFIRLGFVRHLVVAGISVLSAILLALSPLGLQRDEAVYFLLLGCSLLVTGAISFVALLRTPLATEGGE